jgi:predicted type IV restriction endonuclease
MDPFSSAKAKMTDLAREHATVRDMNEATTRLRVIDKLLLDCLGWHTSDVETEKPYNREYVDYALGRPVTEAILEAKREGIHFALPAGVEGRRIADIETLITDPSMKAAVTQVMRYCQARGVPIAIICNGHQLAAFYASRQDGVPPLEGRALIFSSLNEMSDDFMLFWNVAIQEASASYRRLRTCRGYRLVA